MANGRFENDLYLLEEFPEIRAAVSEFCEKRFGFTPDVIATLPDAFIYRCIAEYPQSFDENARPDNFRSVIADVDNSEVVEYFLDSEE